jgi:hypothetical protein
MTKIVFIDVGPIEKGDEKQFALNFGTKEIIGEYSGYFLYKSRIVSKPQNPKTVYAAVFDKNESEWIIPCSNNISSVLKWIDEKLSVYGDEEDK